MKGKEIFESFTPEQKKEFNEDVEGTIKLMIDSGNIHRDKVHETKCNIRLKGEIYLNVTLQFIVDPQETIQGNIKEIKKFDTIDQYLDSINQDKGLKDNWMTLK